MSKYRDVKDIKDEQWPEQYRYKVLLGFKLIELNLKKQAPSHVSIAGNRVLTSYEGQPPTCYNSNEQGHHSSECPYRRSAIPSNTSTRAESWAQA